MVINTVSLKCGGVAPRSLKASKRNNGEAQTWKQQLGGIVCLRPLAVGHAGVGGDSEAACRSVSRLYAPGLELRHTEEANERLDLLLDSRDYRQCAEVLFLDDAGVAN